MNSLRCISRKFILAACVASLLFACARQGAPTGGPKDTDPPKVDTATSTRNFSTRFSSRRIELGFDEWVTLTEVGTQVVVSPPLAKRPEITLKGKKVIVEFNEKDTLRPNTTYTINFGLAVKDLHEGNPAKDLRFVFSTGDYLDSLTVRGNIVDAFTGDPVDNVSVMLYDNLSDSVVRKEKPYYFARTDKTGLFDIQNVREGTFKVTAIEDASGDLKWDGQNERIGFPDSLLALNDSTKGLIRIKLFKNQPKFRFFDSKTLRYGLVKLTFTASPDSVVIRTEASDVRLLAEHIQDTIFVWYDRPVPTPWQLLAGADTVEVRNLLRENFFKNYKFSPTDLGSGGGSKKRAGTEPAAQAGAPRLVKNVSQHPSKPAVIPFNAPITAVDTSKWLFKLDSIDVRDFSAKPDSTAPRNLNITVAWKPGKSYKLTLLPGAVTDFYGTANVDTLERLLGVYAEKQLGGLNLTLQDLKPGSRYVLQLLNGSTLEEERIVEANAAEQKVVFTNLLAATYTARLIEDRNRNGHWDTGDYFAHRQPEPVFTKKLDALRANWELEATMRAGVEEPPKKK
ncbi:MAG TPA: Ig-like domain-containing protein [Saprospiraceae bacterium]|nr:Ig-like domain-containing protein [Saprospiraceae bacterium]